MKHPNKPKLLVLTSSFPTEPGDETCGYIRDFARALSAEFNVRVLAPSDGKAVEWPEDSFSLARSSAWLPGRFIPFGATVDFNDLLARGLPARLASGLSLTAFVKDAIKYAFEADVICSHWLVPSGLIGAMISRVTGKPHIAIEHSGALHLLARLRAGGSLARFIVRGSHSVVTVSEDLKTRLARLCPEAKNKIDVIPMGVARMASTFAPDDTQRPPTVLFIGRLSKIKGVDVLIRAMSGIKDARLIVAGEGEPREGLERLAREHSLSATFTGKVGSVERDRLLSSCEVVVIPSRVMPCGRTEGTPVVCLEAMAAGRPVIASRVGGLAELIRDGENGMLYDAGDHVGLSEKLNLVLSDSSLRQRLSLRGQETAAGFGWSKVGERFSKRIHESLKRHDSTI